MNSIKTKHKHYLKQEDQKCIAEVIFVTEEKGIRAYVAWEWEDMAKSGVFGFIKSRETYSSFQTINIDDVADFGWDISGTEEAKHIFSNLFKRQRL